MKNGKKLALFLKLVWSVSPGYIMLLAADALVGGGRIFLNVLLPKFLIDELTGNMDITRIILFGALIVGGNLLIALLEKLLKRRFEVKSRYMSEMLLQKLSEKIMNVEYSCLETPFYLDLKERAAFAISNQNALLMLVFVLARALNSIITLVGLAAVIITLSPLLVVTLLVIIGTMFALQFRFMKKQLEFTQRIIPYNRKYGYYVGCCYDDKLHKDTRLYSMGEMLSDGVVKYNKEIVTNLDEFYMGFGRYLGVHNIINDLQAAIAYGYVGIRVFTDALGPRLGYGSFTMYISAVIGFSKALQDFASAFNEALQVLGYLDPFAQFMTLTDAKDIGGSTPAGDEIESIRFENVSFAYPGSDKLVLYNISFDIKQGERISIVGLNGAGKTTLVKLLCRLYKPTSGTIYINGKDIFEYEHTSYMKLISAVFQDYKLFAFTVDENITGKKAGSNLAQTADVLHKVGLDEKMAELDNGIYTMLGKAYDEDGTEFSGGETQKIAIARALYKRASLIILDEPTSALDPLAEAEIYENFNSLISGKTAIYISHRMSSSVFCDRILIIDGGTAVDYDTHSALMQKTDGLYYKLFMSQAENYRIGKAMEEELEECGINNK